MKAIEVLEWICRESISGENLNIIDVPEQGDNEWEQNEDWWINQFGMYPPYPIKEGKYLYFYVSQIEDMQIGYPDAQIELCNTGTIYDYDYINLYKLED